MSTFEDEALLLEQPQPGAEQPPLRYGRLVVERTWLKWGTKPYLFAGDTAALALASVAVWTFGAPDLLGICVGLTFFVACSLYRPRLSRSLLDDLPYLVAGAVLAALARMALGASSDGSDRDMVYGSTAVLAVVLVRIAAYSTVRRARISGRVRYNAVVIGAGTVGIQLARTLQRRPEYGVDPVGFVDVRPRVERHEDLPAPLLGSYEDLPALIQDFHVRDVIVAFGSMRESDMVTLLRTCDRLNCEIFFVPRLFELHHTSREMDMLWGIPLIRMRRATFRTPSWRVKRLFDVVVSAVALMLLAPVMVGCAIAVRLEGGPGVIFRQIRVGLDGHPFEVFKFRSLTPVDGTESATQWCISHDDRLGPVGRFLRKTSLDELPQLWNILVGHMSLVGPRPERPHFVEEFTALIPRYTARHRVPAGLTGWSQIHGLRGDTSIEDRARFDNFYIENWSLWGDVKIMLRTVAQVLRQQGG